MRQASAALINDQVRSVTFLNGDGGRYVTFDQFHIKTPRRIGQVSQFFIRIFIRVVRRRWSHRLLTGGSAVRVDCHSFYRKTPSNSTSNGVLGKKIDVVQKCRRRYSTGTVLKPHAEEIGRRATRSNEQRAAVSRFLVRSFTARTSYGDRRHLGPYTSEATSISSGK
jgi:hypothetical protein